MQKQSKKMMTLKLANWSRWRFLKLALRNFCALHVVQDVNLLSLCHQTWKQPYKPMLGLTELKILSTNQKLELNFNIKKETKK